MFLKRYFTISTIIAFVMAFNFAVAQTDVDDKYKEAISSADKYFNAGDYINAKASYQYASKLKPGESYPKEKLKETMDKLREKMALMGQYNEVVTRADKHFRVNEYQEAKEAYQEALKILPGESYPKEKIAEIDKILDAKARKQALYDDAVSRGDKGMQYKKYEAAIKEYEKALEIFPDEQYPKEQLEKAKKLAEEYNKIKKQYDEAIASADRLYDLKYYEQAKTEYQKALKVKPGESHPAGRISEIDKILVKKNEYDKLIAEADELYMAKKIREATEKYQAALKIYPSESYPKDMIAKMNEKQELQSNIDEQYNKAIAAADSFFKSNNYASALKSYENALSIKPGESYPQSKINEINGLIAKMDANEKAYITAMQQGEQFLQEKNIEKAKQEFTKAAKLKPGEQVPKDKLAIIENLEAERQTVKNSYDNAIALAGNALEQKNFDEAIKQYKNALLIMPGDEYATGKLQEAKELKTAYLETQKQYNKLISEADKLFAKKDYAKAKEQYSKAAKLKPEEDYPETKLQETTTLLAAISAQQNSYKQLIANADKLFAEKKYAEAKIEYQKALDLKPGEKYPADKIKEINKILQQQSLALRQYNETIQNADALASEGKYDKAILEYQTAATLRPTEQYPKDKIFEIKKKQEEEKILNEQFNKAMADADESYRQKYYDQALKRYQDALRLKPGSKKAQEKIDEINILLAGQAKKEKEYSEAIALADKQLQENKYEEAKLSYLKASKIKPDEEYPVKKITEIENLIAGMKAKQAEYNRIISTADKLFGSKDYENAKSKYNEALGVLPGEQYPKDKLTEIAEIIAAAKLARQKKYNAQIREADSLFASKQYEKAKAGYRKALEVMPGEDYPVQKIAEIERLITDLATIKANYQKLISGADSHFKAKEYKEARAKYAEAAALLPAETYPEERIDAIDKILKAEQERIQQEYDKAIADADKFFAAGSYGKALDNYRAAHNIKKDEDYPMEMVNKILKIMDENAVRNVMGAPVTIADQAVQKFTFEPVDIASRKSNLIFIKLRNISGNDFRVVLSYGTASGKSGGFMIPVPAGNKTKEYIIPIGKQDKWFTENNNWISLTAQGGDVEVMLVKITRAE